jgi:hypothetical protein
LFGLLIGETDGEGRNPGPLKGLSIFVFEVGRSESDSGGTVSLNPTTMIEAAQVSPVAEEFTFNAKAEKERLVFLQVEGESEFTFGRCVEFRILKLVGPDGGLIAGRPIQDTIREVIDQTGFRKSSNGTKINIFRDMGMKIGI